MSLGHKNHIKGDSVSIADATIANLTASKPVFSDATKKLVSTGTVPVNQGGTGATTLADGGLVIGNVTGAVEVVTAGATTEILVGGGTATKPAWGTNIPTAVTIGSKYIYRADGTDVPVADGGTGASTFTANKVLKGNTTSAIAESDITDDGTKVTVGHDLCISETAYFDAVQTATGDGSTTIDWGLGNKFVFTHGAMNETFTFTSPGGPCSLTLVMIQDGAGSRTSTWPGTVKWPSNGTAPTLSTGIADVDIVTFFWDGTSYYGQAGLDFA